VRKIQEAWAHEENERLWLSYTRHLRLEGRSPLTAKNYFKSIFRLDKRVQFTEAKKLDLEEFFFDELDRVSKATVNNYFISCRVFFGWLLREGFTDRNPVEGISVPSSDTKDPEVLTDEELKSLIKSCQDGTFLGVRDEAILRLFSEPGSPRLGEMSGLKVSDVDWRNCLIKVTGKTGTRVIPYSSKTANCLEKYLTARGKHKHSGLDALWVCSRGKLKDCSFGAMLSSRCKKAGIREIHCHLLRHTAGHRAMSAGISDQNMQVLFGWSGPRMLAVYGRSNKKQRAIASARSLALGDRL
jgi:site-specific recombinase XerD